MTFLTRTGCSLCAAAEPVVRSAAARARVRLEVRDVDEDPHDRRRYSDKVPVVLLDGREHSYWTVDATALDRALRAGPRGL